MNQDQEPKSVASPEEVERAGQEVGVAPQPRSSEVAADEVPVYEIPEEHLNTTPEEALKEFEEAEKKESAN